MNRWFPSQISLKDDVAGLRSMSQIDTEYYKFLFVFLGMAEELVNFNIGDMINEFSSHDVSHYYIEQMAMENIHSRVYANILNMFFNNNRAEVLAYGKTIIEDPFLEKKIQWLHSRVRNAETRAQKVILFFLIEGIFFISSFYTIGLLRIRGLMSGVCMANDYICRDELLHTRAAGLLYKTLIPEAEKLPEAWIRQVFQEAVEVEYEFVVSKGKGVTLVNFVDIRAFLEATADRLLKMIGCRPLFGTAPPDNCPLVYTGSFRAVNFFERDNTEYTSSVENDL